VGSEIQKTHPAKGRPDGPPAEFVAGYAVRDVFFAAATSKCAQTAGQSVRSTWFEWHKSLDGTTSDLSLSWTEFCVRFGLGLHASLRQRGMSIFLGLMRGLTPTPNSTSALLRLLVRPSVVS
jgi:hypothetical protein